MPVCHGNLEENDETNGNNSDSGSLVTVTKLGVIKPDKKVVADLKSPGKIGLELQVIDPDPINIKTYGCDGL